MKNETVKEFIEYLQNKGYTAGYGNDIFSKFYRVRSEEFINLDIFNKGSEYTVLCKPDLKEIPEDLFFVETERSDGKDPWYKSNADFLIQNIKGRLYQIRLSQLKQKVSKFNPMDDFQTWLPLTSDKRGEYALGYTLDINELVQEGIAVMLI